MPVDIKIDLKNKIVYSKAFGEVTGQDLIDHPVKLEKFTDFRADFDHIIDLTSVEKFNIKSKYIYEIAKISLFSTKSKRALVADKSEIFSFIRMYDLVRKPGEQKIKIFKNREDAFTWITKEKL